MASSSQNLETRQTLSQRPILSQQQLRFVKMLELNAPELEEAVDRELEENEALEEKEETTEEDIRRYPLYALSQGAREDYEFAPADTSASLYDYLNAQLPERNLPPRVEQGARYLIGNLDGNGYLRADLGELVDQMAFREGLDLAPDEARLALQTVQSLDPPGIGASDLRECLRLQLEALPADPVRDLALRIIDEAYYEFTLKHKPRITTRLGADRDEVDKAIKLITGLNPKPGASMSSDPTDSANVIVPDFLIDDTDGELTVTLNNRVPELRVSQTFEQAIATADRTPTGRPRKGSEYIVSRYNDARDFIRILSQRQQTMMTVMSAILKIQKEYFLTQDVYRLRPMMIKDVSDLTGLDMSVISRATNNKFVATSWGVFPLRFFFSEKKEGTEEQTNRKIEARLESLVNAEDKRHPLSDQRLMEEMNSLGFDLSRRTVAKYRDRLGIPVARLRKEL